jgi:hypothetical protein
MRTILCIGTRYLAMIFTLPIVLLAGDLLGGTWDLDIAASKYDPGPERKSDTRIYRVDGIVLSSFEITQVPVAVILPFDDYYRRDRREGCPIQRHRGIPEAKNQ